MAGTIGNITSEYDDGAIGDPASLEVYNYTAQTFVAAGDHLQWIEFLADAGGPGSNEYNLLVTTVKPLGGGEFQPGTVLKEVSLTEPFDSDVGLHTVRVDLRGLDLVAGETYAIIFDGYVTRGTPDDLILIGYNDDLYADGFLADLRFGAGRSADFNSDWDENSGDYDIAFLALFSDEGNTIPGTKKNDKIDATHAPKGEGKATDFDDTIYGKNGNDKLRGGDGYDYLDGGKGKDKLYGGNDGDDLLGGKDKDKLFGGDGEDCYLFDFKMTKNSAKKHWDKIFGFDIDDDTICLKQSRFSDLDVGELPDTDTHVTLKGSKLYYNNVKFAQFKGDIPASVDDIHIEVYA
ncbi:MAG: hypothetical protein KDJ88_04970 [Bauldia sp.]|nr:hypothetical protein [Bauldia sp.]